MLKNVERSTFKDLKKMFKSSIRKMTREDIEMNHVGQNFHLLLFSQFFGWN